MKTGKKALILLAILAALVCLITGCDGNKPAGTDKATKAPIEIPTTEPGFKFNDGIVDYIVEEEAIYNNPFESKYIGMVSTAKRQGVKSLFEYVFSQTSDPACEGNAIANETGKCAVDGGKMYVNYDKDAESKFGSGKAVWSPKTVVVDDYYIQSQITVNGKVYANDDSPEHGALIGCFVSDNTGKTSPAGDGIWISFNPVSGKVTVFAGEGWNAGGDASVSCSTLKITDDYRIDVICTNDKNIHVFLNKTKVLYTKVSGTDMDIYDGEKDKKIAGVKIKEDEIKGKYFTVICENGGIYMKDVTILGCTKGEKDVKKNIKAVPTEGNSLGLDITDKKDLVSICYSNWFNAILGNGTKEINYKHNVTDYTELYGFNKETGFGEGHNNITAFHYWAKPAQGYYRSTDKQAHRNNMDLLYKAGVDFIIIDYTYATSPGYKPGTDTWKTYIDGPTTALLDTIMEMRAEGLGTPYVVFWVNDDSMFDHMYKYFHSQEKWQDCFVYWDGKPFIMNWRKSEKTYEKFTVRAMYGLQGKVSEGQWSYLEINNAKTVSFDAKGNPEHVCCDVATQETYMSLPTAHGRQGGRFWNSQWKVAFEYHPKIVTVTWWNEWCAQLYYVDGVGYIFTDNFNIEYSRDVEPMEGGHGDLYYRWLIEYIRCYKNGLDCPELIQD